MNAQPEPQKESISRRRFFETGGSLVAGIMATGALMSMPSFADDALAASKSTKKKQKKKGPSRLHIMWYGLQDAMILESNGHFGIVDSGEDASYPDGSDSRYPVRRGTTTGTSRVHDSEFIAYLKSLGGKPGNVDFYIGTHAHSDHIGSAPQVIQTFKPKRVYTPEYSDSYITADGCLWDNRYVYDRLISAAKENNCQLIQNFKGKKTFMLGDMKIRLLNTSGYYKKHPVLDANDMSLAVLVEANGVRALLAGDIEIREGRENLLAKKAGKVDLLKAGHHGCAESNSSSYLKAISPEVIAVTQPIAHIGTGPFSRFRKQGCVLVYEERATEVGRPATIYTFGKSLRVNGRVVPTFTRTRTGLIARRGSTPCNFLGLVARGNNWYYFDHSTKSIKNSWKLIGWTWYYFGSNGAMKYGWLKYKGAWYYLKPGSGRMATGWVKVNGSWYYMNSSGAMQTGWVTINGVAHYFNSSGVWQQNTLYT